MESSIGFQQETSLAAAASAAECLHNIASAIYIPFGGRGAGRCSAIVFNSPGCLFLKSLLPPMVKSEVPLGPLPPSIYLAVNSKAYKKCQNVYIKPV